MAWVDICSSGFPYSKPLERIGLGIPEKPLDRQDSLKQALKRMGTPKITFKIPKQRYEPCRQFSHKGKGLLEKACRQRMGFPLKQPSPQTWIGFPEQKHISRFAKAPRRWHVWMLAVLGSLKTSL